MIALQWLLKALRRLLHDHALRSPLRVILSLWSFFKLQLRKIGRNRKGSEKLNGKPKPRTVYNDRDEKVVRMPYQPPVESSIVVCASRVPDSLGLLPFAHAGSSNLSLSESSQNVQTSSLHPEDSFPRPRTLSRSHISYPNVAGHTPGRNASRTSITGGSAKSSRTHSPASTSRLSIRDHSLRAPSPISIAASSRPASPAQAAVPITQAPVPSHEPLSHISIVTQPNAHDDSPRITLRRETGAPQGGEQGYDIALTTSPVQEGVSEAGNWPDTRSSVTRNELRDIHQHFYPMLPENSTRYEATGTIPRTSDTYRIPHFTRRFEEEQPEGWNRSTHPEGARYFFHPDKNVYTDANILDADVLSEIETAMTIFFGFCTDAGFVLTSSTNLVLDVELTEKSDDKYIYKYYLVDHDNRSIFWLDELAFNEESFDICYQVKGVWSSSHIRHHIEQQYWYHCHLFPTSLTLTPDLVDELRDILMHWISDSFTSTTSTAPYTLGELQGMLSLAKNFRKNTKSGGCVSAYSRLMNVFCHHRFTHFHGQPIVRLDLDRSVYDLPGSGPYKTWLIKILSPLMFSTPDIYYHALDNIWVDRLIHQVTWEKFINGMRDEWQELILFGTVLLNANVAFLAIQSIDEDPPSPSRSPAQIGSYLSVVVTVGSIIIGLFLARKHRVKPKESAQDVATYLDAWDPDDHGRNESRIGLETLAILYSVPYALLMWGVLLFLLGFSYMCFRDANAIVITLSAGAWIVTCVFVLWCILALTSWHQPERTSFWQRIFEGVDRKVIGLSDAIRKLKRGEGWGKKSQGAEGKNDSQDNSQVMESPQELRDLNRPYTSRPQSPMAHSSHEGSQGHDGPIKQLFRLSFFGRKRSSHDTARTVV